MPKARTPEKPRNRNPHPVPFHRRATGAGGARPVNTPTPPLTPQRPLTTLVHHQTFAAPPLEMPYNPISSLAMPSLGTLGLVGVLCCSASWASLWSRPSWSCIASSPSGRIRLAPVLTSSTASSVDEAERAARLQPCFVTSQRS